MAKKWDDSISEKHLHPESLMMGYGYKPEWSEGALKSPIFQTSTFVFETAEEGKAFFEVATGQRPSRPGEKTGLIYSRLNNPDLEIVEDRLTLWDGAESATVFGSGMAAIATTLLAYLRPGDVLLHSCPLYGGTDHLVNDILAEFGIKSVGFLAGHSREDITTSLLNTNGPLKMILIETPANPTNALIDIEMCAEIAQTASTEEDPVPLVVDNTFLGPIFQRPLDHGADLVIYSATKYLGGHSDLIAGACLGSERLIAPIRAMRTYLGTHVGPWTGWLLMRSLETLQLRMMRQAENAVRVADFLAGHRKVSRIHYLGFIRPDDPQHDIFKRQCLGPGAMISFDVEGGEPGAFRFLNALKLIHLAVSLGSTESLAEHPGTMTHSGLSDASKRSYGITDGLVRVSVGVENPDDLILDIRQALDSV
ncbi:MAG: cystathionine gamma-synthase family protein [Acidimicrobiia bacterium]|nr:cystathionine gamma-synthase family protein [Acidimicrobiia bacterium]MDH5615894.1 cystathionine gamma-synthase family protein [Acidimicrobiia bacterium]